MDNKAVHLLLLMIKMETKATIRVACMPLHI